MRKTPIALIYPKAEPSLWRPLFENLDPSIDLQIWPDIDFEARIEFAIAYNQPEGSLSRLPHLKVLCSLRAGVEDLVCDPALPSHVRVVRYVDESLTRQMVEYVVMMVLAQKRRLLQFRIQQQEQRWDRHLKESPRKAAVGIMGLGEIGGRIAMALRSLDQEVRGWSRSPKILGGCETFHGRERLEEFLSGTDILVSVLPLTRETREILNYDLFFALRRGASIISVGRGDHLVENDLLKALDEGQLSEAALDVFPIEPLPPGHLFWSHPKIVVTPHVAGITDIPCLVARTMETFHCFQRGAPLPFEVDREAGY